MYSEEYACHPYIGSAITLPDTVEIQLSKLLLYEQVKPPNLSSVLLRATAFVQIPFMTHNAFNISMITTTVAKKFTVGY